MKVIRRDHDRLLLVAPAHDFEEQVGGVRVVGEVADFVDREEAGSEIAPEPMLERAGGLLLCEIEDKIGGGQETGGMAGQERFVDQVLAIIVLPSPCARDDDHLFTLREKPSESLDERGRETSEPLRLTAATRDAPPSTTKDDRDPTAQ